MTSSVHAKSFFSNKRICILLSEKLLSKVNGAARNIMAEYREANEQRAARHFEHDVCGRHSVVSFKFSTVHIINRNNLLHYLSQSALTECVETQNISDKQVKQPMMFCDLSDLDTSGSIIILPSRPRSTVIDVGADRNIKERMREMFYHSHGDDFPQNVLFIKKSTYEDAKGVRAVHKSPSSFLTLSRGRKKRSLCSLSILCPISWKIWKLKMLSVMLSWPLRCSFPA